MDASDLKLEKKYLLISALGNVLVGCIGIFVAAVSSSQAILLDGLFNVTYFATGLFTIRVASLVAAMTVSPTLSSVVPASTSAIRITSM